MSERYTKEMHEQFVAEQEERADREQRERQERVEKTAAKREYVASGGTEAAFEDAWPEIREEQRRRSALSADERARGQQRRSRVSRI